jgi:hypothetical protein
LCDREDGFFGADRPEPELRDGFDDRDGLDRISERLGRLGLGATV